MPRPRGVPRLRNERRHQKKHTKRAIGELLEFYFGDANFGQDRYLKSLADRDPHGCAFRLLACALKNCTTRSEEHLSALSFIKAVVTSQPDEIQTLQEEHQNRQTLPRLLNVSISELLRFNKLKALTRSRAEVADAARRSNALEVSDDDLSVRRTTAFVPPTDVDERTIYVENLLRHATHDWVSDKFSRFGKVVYVSLPKFKTTGDCKGYAFVQFATAREAQFVLTLASSVGGRSSKVNTFPKLGSKDIQRLEHQASVIGSRSPLDAGADDPRNDMPSEIAASEGGPLGIGGGRKRDLSLCSAGSEAEVEGPVSSAPIDPKKKGLLRKRMKQREKRRLRRQEEKKQRLNNAAATALVSQSSERETGSKQPLKRTFEAVGNQHGLAVYHFRSFEDECESSSCPKRARTESTGGDDALAPPRSRVVEPPQPEVTTSSFAATVVAASESKTCIDEPVADESKLADEKDGAHVEQHPVVAAALTDDVSDSGVDDVAHEEEVREESKKRTRSRSKKSKREARSSTYHFFTNLTVLSKAEWLEERARYIELQKTRMTQLKRIVRGAMLTDDRTGQGESELAKGEDETKSPSFIANSVIRVVLSPDAASLSCVREQVSKAVDLKLIKYIDIQQSRVPSSVCVEDQGAPPSSIPDDIANAVLSSSSFRDSCPSAHLLEGNDEATFWSNVARSRRRRKKRRGKATILNKYAKLHAAVILQQSGAQDDT